MRPSINNQAQLHKNRLKFIQIFRRYTASEHVPVLNRPALQKLLKHNRKVLGITQKMSFEDFVACLVELKALKVFHFQYPKSLSFTRYAHPDTSLYAVISTFYSKSYFSHYTAMYLHQLTEQLPKTIYLNLEQTPKPRSTSRKNLEQENIDRAFNKQQRLSNNFASFENHSVYLLSGKATQNEGVETISLSDHEQIQVTGLERTLIDIAVRPSYAGGVQQVLQAFERAKDLGISVNRLSATLKKLDYVYPYHQVIGFYLEKAGYSDAQIKLMERIEKHHDFYLDYNLRNPDYVQRWRLYIPKGF